ncbi:Colicin V production protein [Thermanaeromonas toyohensis ToBE]|uniref:Colicin V production protein n=1 Tax=Thermanaeromonas toyohensis ToBE TaxID=698762 RepID=A0A1W1W4P8_9FIRM|nr:CvpA family protein [Thermanaeromonas toyohensis]SMC00044.1 Colicin V production protein [Thermanaeromonas toyohensis ToBE]
MNYADLFLILSLGWAGFQGYRRGFAKLATGLVGYLVGVFISLNLAGPLIRWADDSWKISGKMASWLAPYLPLPRFILDQELSVPVIKQVDAWLSGWPLPPSFKAGLWEAIQQNGGRPVTLGEALARQLALGLLKVLAMVVLFYISLWILRRLSLWLTHSWGWAPWGLSCRLLGLALGLASQAIYLSLVLGILELGIEKGWFLKFPFLLPVARELSASRLTPPLLDLFSWLRGLVNI